MLARYEELTFIIPTLNEAGNINKVISSLMARYKGARIIFADDGSKDGTREAIISWSKKYKGIELLDRSNEKVHGLTVSVINAAMIVRTKYTIVMDADMQHPISRIEDIYKKLHDYDIVVGVRTHVRRWGWHRRLLSKGMAVFSYIVFKLRGKPTCNDMMSGFFGIRSDVFKRTVKKKGNRYIATGYKVLLDTLRLVDKPISVGEVKYATFHMRKEGKSKFKLKIIIDALKSTLC
ncbi:MAG: glycosyltransferase [Candidatus Micrarchaeia archaeon]